MSDTSWPFRHDYSPPGSTVHGIFQVRIQEWVAISSSRGYPPPRDGTHLLCLLYCRRTLYPVSHQRSPLLKAVMFYNVTGNTEFMNTEPRLLGARGVRFPRNFWWRRFLNRSICNLVLCVFLFKDTFCNVHCWFARIELRPTALPWRLKEVTKQMHSKNLWHFLREAHHSFLARRRTACPRAWKPF